MSIIEKKEKNLIQLIDKLDSLSLSYSQPNYEIEKIRSEKNELFRKKNEIEKKNQELAREHKYLKKKIQNLQLEVNKKSEIEDKFNQLSNAVRFLSIDAVQKANSGHPGMPMGMADVATVLFKYHLRFNPKNPKFAIGGK